MKPCKSKVLEHSCNIQAHRYFDELYETYLKPHSNNFILRNNIHDPTQNNFATTLFGNKFKNADLFPLWIGHVQQISWTWIRNTTPTMAPLLYKYKNDSTTFLNAFKTSLVTLHRSRSKQMFPKCCFGFRLLYTCRICK